MDADLFNAKCKYHEEIMSKLLGDKIPMLMAETEEGKKELDKINKECTILMNKKFGD